MKLSILIPYIPEHDSLLKRLLNILTPQLNDDVELITKGGESYIKGGKSTGVKRNELAEESTGDYIVFVDADDIVSDDYVDTLLEAITYGRDLICFDVLYKKGRKEKKVIYSLDFKRDENLNSHYKRLPNHLMAVKRDVFMMTKFKDSSFGEDSDYAKRLKANAKSQTLTYKTLYTYLDTGSSIKRKKNER